MPHIITREWRGYPATIQLADQRVYSTLWQAEEELEELYREFPGRVFRIREANGPVQPESRKPASEESFPLPNTTIVAREQAGEGLREYNRQRDVVSARRELLQSDRES